MAYDPYARGDNPWLGNLDMPRANPLGRPGAAKVAAMQKPPEQFGPPIPPGIPGAPAPAMPPVRPPPAQLAGAPAPAMPPTRPPPEQLAGAPPPNIQTGILQPGFFEKLFGIKPPPGQRAVA
jgi:hypothetical protein